MPSLYGPTLVVISRSGQSLQFKLRNLSRVNEDLRGHEILKCKVKNEDSVDWLID